MTLGREKVSPLHARAPRNRWSPAPVSLALASLLASLVAFGCGNNGDPFAIFDQTPRAQVMTISPPDGATGVSVNTVVTVAFPAELAPDSVHRGTFNLVGPSGIPVSRTVRYDAPSRVVSIRPDSPLEGNTAYQVTVQGVRPASPGFVFRPATFTFATGDPPEAGAPEVVAVTPVPDQQNVNINTTVTISFSEPMDPSSVLAAVSISGGIGGTFSFNGDNTVLTFTPGSSFPLGSLILVQVSRLATDVTGVPLRVGFASSFRTPVPGTFSLVSSIPADGATTASPSDPLRYTFSEPVDRTTVTTNFRISNNLVAIPAPTDANFSFANNDQVVFYDPRPSLPGFVGFPGGSMVRTTFTPDLTSAVTGLGLPRRAEVNFTIEQIAPTVVMTVPTNGSTNVQAAQVIRVTFSEPLDPSTVDATSFAVTQGPAVPGTLSFEDGDRTVVFTPSMDFQNVGVPVQVDIATTVTDRGGTGLAAAFVLSFSIDTQPPLAPITFPLPGAMDVPVTLAPNRRISFDFNEALDQAATAATFMIAPDQGGGMVQFPAADILVYTPPVIIPPSDAPALPNQKLLNGNTTYTVSFSAIDLSGNASAVMLTFDTDDTPPTGIGSPMPTTTDTTPLVSVQFSEIMDKDSLAAMGAVTFRQVAPAMMDIPVTLNLTDTSLDFTAPTLVVNNTYELVVDTSVTDLGGNPLAAPVQFQFQVIP